MSLPQDIDNDDNNRFTISQFTGLHAYDNAPELKELYEGDILEKDNGFIGVITFRKDNAQFVAVDKYGKTYCELSATTGGDVYVCEQFKLLGNIYEHPELISPEAKKEA